MGSKVLVPIGEPTEAISLLKEPKKVFVPIHPSKVVSTVEEAKIQIMAGIKTCEDLQVDYQHDPLRHRLFIEAYEQLAPAMFDGMTEEEEYAAWDYVTMNKLNLL